jgi:hypothetical protein
MAKVQDPSNGYFRRSMGCTPTRGVMGEYVPHILKWHVHVVCTRFRLSATTLDNQTSCVSFTRLTVMPAASRSHVAAVISSRRSLCF